MVRRLGGRLPAAATDAVGAGKEALPNLSAAAARAQDTHHAVVAFAGTVWLSPEAMHPTSMPCPAPAS